MAEKILLPKKNKSFTKEEKISYWIKWQESNISKKKFCDQNKLPNTFYSWGKLLPSNTTDTIKAKRKSNKLQQLSLLPLQSSEDFSSGLENDFVKCSYHNNGVNLELTMSLRTMVQFILEINNAITVIR